MSDDWTFLTIKVASENLSGNLSNYTKLHLKLTDFANSAENKLTLYFKENKGNTQSMDYVAKVEITPDGDGVFELDLTSFDWKNNANPSETIDKTNIVDVTIYGGARTDDSNVGSVKITEAYLVKPDKPKSDVITNGDLEGTDVSCFFKTEKGVGGPNPATITDGEGKGDSKGIKVQSASGASNSYDSQFFIRLPYILPKGTEFKLEFDYKASQAVSNVDTQTHKEPGQYIHYTCIGNLNFTTEWQSFSQTITVSQDMELMRTIALDLAVDKEHNVTFYFDNIHVWINDEDITTLAVSTAAPVTITMGDKGSRTYCYDYALDFTDVEGLEAYVLTSFEVATNTFTFTRVYKSQGGAGLYLVGAEGDYDVPKTDDAPWATNILKGIGSRTNDNADIAPTKEIDHVDYTNLVLAGEGANRGFHPLSSAGKIGNNKAYLQLTTADYNNIPDAEAPARYIFEDDNEATRIVATEAAEILDGKFYDLSGREVKNPTPGIYIVNGKKVVIK